MVSKWVISYNPNIPHLYVGYNPFTNFLGHPSSLLVNAFLVCVAMPAGHVHFSSFCGPLSQKAPRQKAAKKALVKP